MIGKNQNYCCLRGLGMGTDWEGAWKELSGMIVMFYILIVVYTAVCIYQKFSSGTCISLYVDFTSKGGKNHRKYLTLAEDMHAEVFQDDMFRCFQFASKCIQKNKMY